MFLASFELRGTVAILLRRHTAFVIVGHVESSILAALEGQRMVIGVSEEVALPLDAGGIACKEVDRPSKSP